MKERLKRYVSEQLLSDRGLAIHDHDDLLDSGIDSVGMMSLVLFIEEEWQVAVPPEDVVLENFQSIAAIESYLRTRVTEST
jgi:acyl carrier protein